MPYILNPKTSEDGVIRDVCDGVNEKGNPLFGNDPQSLKIHLYYDDFQISHPLGNKIQKYKLNAFYFLLGNIEPKCRASLDVINLSILCHNHLSKAYGLSTIIDPLLKDIRKLETEGIQVTFENREYTFFGSISTVIADNLAAHALGGFFENFSSVERICRHCNCRKEEIQYEFDEKNFRLRSKSIYDQQVNAISENPELPSTYEG